VNTAQVTLAVGEMQSTLAVIWSTTAEKQIGEQHVQPVGASKSLKYRGSSSSWGSWPSSVEWFKNKQIEEVQQCDAGRSRCRD